MIEKFVYEFAKDHYETIQSLSKEQILKKILVPKYAKKCRPLPEDKLKEILSDTAKNTIENYEFQQKLLKLF